MDRGSRGGVAGQKESRGERTTAHAIITSFCLYCRRRIKLPWGSVVKPEVYFSGTCSCSICFSSVKPCRYVPHYFLHMLYLALIPPFIAPPCPPHFKDSSSLFSHRGGIYSTHHAFFLTQFSFPHLSCPPAPSFPPFTWPQLTQDFSFRVHTARHCGKSAGVNSGTGRGIDGRGKEKKGRGRFEKTLNLLFSQSRDSPRRMREQKQGGGERKWDNLCRPSNPQTAMRLCSTHPLCKHKHPKYMSWIYGFKKGKLKAPCSTHFHIFIIHPKPQRSSLVQVIIQKKTI